MMKSTRLILVPLIAFSMIANILASSSPVIVSASVPPTVAPAGTNFEIMDNTGAGTGVNGKPGVAFDGANFLTGWCADAFWNDAGGYMVCRSLWAARISPEGTVLDADPIAISPSGNEEIGTPSILFDGTNFIMVFLAKRQGVYELYGVRIKPDGTVLDPGGMQLTTGANSKPFRVLGFAGEGTNFLITWRTNQDNIRAIRINTANGIQNLDAPDGFALTDLNFSYYPSAAFDGTNYLVTWHDGRSGPWENLDIYGARVTPSGEVLDFNGFNIVDDPANQDHQTVAFNGTSYWVIWFDSGIAGETSHGSVKAARVNPNGTVIDTTPLVISERAGGQIAPRVVCQPDYCLVVWLYGIDMNFRLADVFARRLLPDGTLLDEKAIPVSTSIGHQWGPVLGYGNGRYLVVWNDSTGFRNYNGAIWGQILTEREDATPATLVFETKAREKQSPRRADVHSEGNWIAEPLDNPTACCSDGIAFGLDDSHVFGQDHWLSYENGAWVTQATTPFMRVYGAFGYNASELWIGGWCRYIMMSNGSNWVDHGCHTDEGQYSIKANIITALWGPPGAAPWGVGDQGTTIFYDPTIPDELPSDHGWHLLKTGHPYDLHDVWGSSANNIYAVSERGTILRYNGNNWSAVTQPIPTNQTLNAIWGSGPNDIFVVGDWGTILHYDGTHWIEQDSGTNKFLLDVWGFDGQDVYAVGWDGLILHYDGNSWQQQESVVSFDLLSVWGAKGIRNQTGEKVVWAAGSGDRVLKSVSTYEAFKYIYIPLVRK